MKFYMIEKFKIEDDFKYEMINIKNEKNEEIIRLIKDEYSKVIEMADFDQNIARIYNISEKNLIVIKGTNAKINEFKYEGDLKDAFETEKNYLKIRILNDLKDHITSIEEAINKKI